MTSVRLTGNALVTENKRRNAHSNTPSSPSNRSRPLQLTVEVPLEPDHEQLRALLVHRGYDPDANEDTLDRLGQLDIATMGAFLSAYKAMVAVKVKP